tara:strand:+ start:845 stop:1036 length:192 start_codon:yes stop_codon:yes gene_type:complete
VNLHVLLEVEEGEFITLLEAKKLHKSLVSLEDALILLTLKIVFLAVGVDTLGDLSPSNEFILS